MKVFRFRYIFLFVFLAAAFPATAQPFSTIDLSKLKPEQYKRKVLRAEKTTTDELAPLAAFFQNMFSHYNFLFNANDRMQKILYEAKKNNKDDYEKLLRFYPYDTEALAQNKYLDTVIEKATSGILMHDLRSKWVDELYFILGNAYFFQKKYDTAAAVYQYINYAFSPRDDGYFVPVGSNVSNSENVFSMVTKENEKSFARRFASPPKRNDAFLWQIRNLIDSGNAVQANSFMQMLKNDVYFPKRLKPYLQEVQAYYFYTLKQWDSAAVYSEKSLEISESKDLKARREYLTAQLYQLADSVSRAEVYFKKASERTIDPQLQLYAEMNLTDLSDQENEKVKMLETLARREKFTARRDLIFYTQAKKYLQQNEPDKAEEAVRKSIACNVDDAVQRSKSFLLLADINYRNQEYYRSAVLYDSVLQNTIQDPVDSVRFSGLQEPMQTVREQYAIVSRNDSLIALAEMPEKERMVFLQKEARRIRRLASKQSSDEALINMGEGPAISDRNAPPDIFRANTVSGEWYFNDQNARTAGYNEFIKKYGNRKNQDNWIRSSMRNAGAAMATGIDAPGTSLPQSGIDSSYVTAEDLLLTLPMGEEERTILKDSVAAALFKTGKTFQNNVMDFDASIKYYRHFLYRFPNNPLTPEVLYNLYLSAYFNKNKALADSAKNALTVKYAASQWMAKLQVVPSQNVSASSVQNEATKMYDDIYRLFLAGKFQEARAAKLQADKIYGEHYWTPQLLYIEAVYHVTQKEDSLALHALHFIRQKFAQSGMAAKAGVMIRVLANRKSIEDYLTKLQIKRYRSEQTPVIAQTKFTRPGKKEMAKEWKNVPNDVIAVLDKDGNPVPKFPDAISDKEKQAAMEAARPVTPDEKEPDEIKLRKIAAAQQLQTETGKTDSVQVATNPFEQPEQPEAAKPAEKFDYNAAAPTYVTVVLDNVDPVYVNEAGNAFNRYNLVMFENIVIDIQSRQLSEKYNMVLLGPFRDKSEANGYINELGEQVKQTIIPWLDAAKYRIISINKKDLDNLQSADDLETYLKNLR